MCSGSSLRRHGRKTLQCMPSLYIDFCKAFDSVDRGLLWEVLSHFGVPPKCLTVLRNLHTNMERRVAYCGELSKFPIHTGVRQGSIEGPVLFILFLAAMMEVAFSRFRSKMVVKLEVAGGDITDVRRFRRPTLIRILDCIYADDTALVSDSFEDMQEIICQLVQTATKFGLLINLQKTVSMRFNPAVQEKLTVPPFYVGNHPLEETDNVVTEEFNMQIGQAHGVFFKLTIRLWNQRGIRKVTKTGLFNAVASSTLLYGAGTWTRKEQQTKRPESVQYRLYSMLHAGSQTNRPCPNDEGI